MREEAPTLFAKYRNVYCIGVGKVNAAINTTILIQRFNPDRVINLGTAGGLTVGSGIHRINTVLQHDVNLTPVGLRPGEHLNDHNSFINLGGEGKTCASGDLFVTEPNKLRMKCDLVEMEAYSVAKTCLLNGIECEIWKYVSDKADENANVTWKEQVTAGEVHYYRILNELNINLQE